MNNNNEEKVYIEASYGLPFNGFYRECDVKDNIVKDEDEIKNILLNELRKTSEFLSSENNIVNIDDVSLVFEFSIFGKYGDVVHNRINDKHYYVFKTKPSVIENAVSMRLIEENVISKNGSIYTESVSLEKPILIDYKVLKKVIANSELENIEPGFKQIKEAISEGDSFEVMIGYKCANMAVRNLKHNKRTQRVRREII